jgi:hypothetical protein
MRTLFEEYFYHDVLIKEISVKNNAKEASYIEFILENEEYQVFKCVFKNVSQLFLLADFRIIGNVFISHAFISETDESIFEYKKSKASFLSPNVLNKIKCFIIQTTRGETIKILAENDVVLCTG